jgi:folylpolyglutamate synthase/dihydropteroate synthase
VAAAVLSELLGLQPTGEIRWGLRRVRTMLESVGRPHMAYRSVHVGGTNGKGSVAAMIASILSSAGHRVGLYTSPHLVDFGERIRIDGQPADEEMLVRGATRLRPLAEELGATFFEATTALAFLCFAEADVDFVVAEVGLGGRLDATNVLLPEVATITNVAWDHADYLGRTLSAIAGEKAGISKPGVPLVLGRLEPEAGRIVRETAARAGAPLLQLGYDAAVRRIRILRDATELEYVGPAWREALRTRLGTRVSRRWRFRVYRATCDPARVKYGRASPVCAGRGGYRSRNAGGGLGCSMSPTTLPRSRCWPRR